MSARAGRVHESDVEALEDRLRALLAAGDGAGEAEISRYEADRERALDQIGDQMREQREYDSAVGVRPWTEAELRQITDQVRAIHAEVTARDQLDGTVPPTGSRAAGREDVEAAGWER